MNGHLIRPATDADAEDVAAIYNHYVTSSVATFEVTPVEAGEMGARIRDVGESSLPWLVGERDGRVSGYAYANRWKGRAAYRFTTESTVYLDPDSTGHGLGTALYRDLIDRLRALGLHTVVGGIALPNPASVALHERLGFQKVAHFREQGRKFDQWVDVGYWQLML